MLKHRGPKRFLSIKINVLFRRDLNEAKAVYIANYLSRLPLV